MKPFVALFVAGSACAAFGCGTSPDSSGPGDPIGFTFESTAGSFASFGWTGAVHDVVQPAGTPFGVKATECSAGVCRFEGPTDPGREVHRRRCLYPMSQECNADSDCARFRKDDSPNSCVYVYDAPIATPLVGTDNRVGACAWSYIPITGEDHLPTIRGTLNLASSVLNLERLAIRLPLNSNPDGTFRGPCAECVGDKKSNDGVRDGTCQLATHRGVGNSPAVPADPDVSPDLGMPCDVNRSGDFEGYEGNYSMDCSPTVLTGTGTPLQFGGSFTSSGFEVAITDQSPDCTTSGKCFCGLCPDNLTACMSDRECGGQPCRVPTASECQPNPFPGMPGYDSNFQINQCKRDPSKFAVASNACASGQCTWDAAEGIGSCKSKLPDGRMIGCYPSDPKPVISAPGRKERVDHVGTTYLVDTAAASCIPLGRSAQLNSQLGLPGLLFQKRNFQITPEYAEDKQ
jgi:hypothetical protein